jgi:hypothetical protein
MDKELTSRVEAVARALDIAIEIRDKQMPSGFRSPFGVLRVQLVDALNEALELLLAPELTRRGMRYSDASHRELIERLRNSQ